MHLKFLFLIFPCLAALIQAIPAPGFSAPISKRQAGPLHYYRRDQLPVDCPLGEPLRVTFKFDDARKLTTNLFPFADKFKIETREYQSHIVYAVRPDQASEFKGKAQKGHIQAEGKLDNKVYFLTSETIERSEVTLHDFKGERVANTVTLIPMSPMDKATGVQCFEVSRGQYEHRIVFGVKKDKGTELFLDTTPYEAKSFDDGTMEYYLTKEIILRPSVYFTLMGAPNKKYRCPLWPISPEKGAKRFKVLQGLFKDHIVYAAKRPEISDVEKLLKLEIGYVATGKDHHMDYFLTEQKLTGDQK